ncbi:hypothetical protein ACG33_10970 [Steroidobacter denitrificans]|uniref:Uncharacterized protein n=1 Tax=Steroidobacter denitrificans TaxID=465721 RepID=A0A127FD56_STEDE|nr:hypothetical protein [Steroidobacter denitrificans]AMN47610.1 hypothetical protein ACG33_10970 [Steroidobacter denitrificans]
MQFAILAIFLSGTVIERAIAHINDGPSLGRLREKPSSGAKAWKADIPAARDEDVEMQAEDV